MYINYDIDVRINFGEFFDINNGGGEVYVCIIVFFGDFNVYEVLFEELFDDGWVYFFGFVYFMGDGEDYIVCEFGDCVGYGGFGV